MANENVIPKKPDSAEDETDTVNIVRPQDVNILKILAPNSSNTMPPTRARDMDLLD